MTKTANNIDLKHQKSQPSTCQVDGSYSQVIYILPSFAEDKNIQKVKKADGVYQKNGDKPPFVLQPGRFPERQALPN